LIATGAIMPLLQSQDRDKCHVDNGSHRSRSLPDIKTGLKAGCSVCGLVYLSILAMIEGSKAGFEASGRSRKYDAYHQVRLGEQARAVQQPMSNIEIVEVSNGVIRSLIHGGEREVNPGLDEVELFTLDSEQECCLPIVHVCDDMRVRRSDRYLSTLRTWIQQPDLHQRLCYTQAAHSSPRYWLRLGGIC
jgi:hypothetical protein